MIDYLSFSGSRTLDYNEVREIIRKEIKKHKPKIVVTHGEPAGVCQLVKEECRRLSVPLLLFFLNVKKNGRGCYAHRTVELMKYSSYAIFIYDGESKGTKNEMEIAEKMKIPYTYHKVEINEFWGNPNEIDLSIEDELIIE